MSLYNFLKHFPKSPAPLSHSDIFPFLIFCHSLSPSYNIALIPSHYLLSTLISILFLIILSQSYYLLSSVIPSPFISYHSFAHALSSSRPLLPFLLFCLSIHLILYDSIFSSIAPLIFPFSFTLFSPSLILSIIFHISLKYLLSSSFLFSH